MPDGNGLSERRREIGTRELQARAGEVDAETLASELAPQPIPDSPAVERIRAERRTDARRRRAASRLDDQIEERDIRAEDVVADGDRMRLDPEVEREVLAERFEREIADDLPDAEVRPEDVILPQETGTGEARLAAGVGRGLVADVAPEPGPEPRREPREMAAVEPELRRAQALRQRRDVEQRQLEEIAGPELRLEDALQQQREIELRRQIEAFEAAAPELRTERSQVAQQQIQFRQTLEDLVAEGRVEPEDLPEFVGADEPHVQEIVGGVVADPPSPPTGPPDDGFLGPVGDALARGEEFVRDIPGVERAAGTLWDWSAPGMIQRQERLVRGALEPLTSPIVERSRALREPALEEFVDPAFDRLEPAEDDSVRLLTEAGRGGAHLGVESTIGAPAFAADFAGLADDARSGIRGSVADVGLVRGTEQIEHDLRQMGELTVRDARDAFERDPVGTAGFATGMGVAGLVGGAAAGLGAGRVGTAARDRIRTLGAQRLDPESMTQPAILRRVERGDSAFPPAQDPVLYRQDPPAAVRQQAREMTPEPLTRHFDEAGAPGETLFKALGVEPGGPGTAGFRAQAGAYEAPGAFVGPELSPHFLRIDAARRRRFSPRPGLPDFGGRPTAVAIRTRVDSPDARTLREFGGELRAREGEVTARTLPRSAVNPGEIEAVIPPGAAFADVGTGPLRDALRRIGIGADFYTDVAGRRVPIRAVADPGELPPGLGGGLRSFLADERAQLAAGRSAPGGRVLRRPEVRPVRPAVDRPLPAIPPSAGLRSPVASPSQAVSPPIGGQSLFVWATSPPGDRRPTPTSTGVPSSPAGSPSPPPGPPSPPGTPTTPGTPSPPGTPPGTPRTPPPPPPGTPTTPGTPRTPPPPPPPNGGGGRPIPDIEFPAADSFDEPARLGEFEEHWLNPIQRLAGGR